jgi:hypothetical protein
MEPVFVKATNPKAILYGLAAVAGGIVVILLGAFGNITLAIGKLALPTWTMYMAGAVVIGIGALILFTGMDARKCAKCGALAESEEAYFPLEQIQTVVDAVEAENADALTDLQKVPKKQMKSVVDVWFCTGCGEVAEVEVKKWEDYQPHDVLPRKPVKGPVAAAFATLVRTHAEWRGEND